MLIEYDETTDVLYVRMRDVEAGGVKRTQQLDQFRLIDFDAAGELVGVEFMQASEGINLNAGPEAEHIGAVVRAFPGVVPAA